MKRILTLLTILLLSTSAFAAEISERDVKVFFDEWLAAQNTGSYSKYADMYAAKFHGIKRSGDHKSGFNHDTWLKDRKLMFKSKMTVTAGNVRIKTAESGASVKFEQTWASTGYKDKGDKLLYLILENGKLRIAREEMLASRVLAGKGTALDSNNLPFAFAMKEGIVIPGDFIPEADLKKLKLVNADTDYIVTVPVDPANLPPSTRSLLGMKVRLYGPKGACESRISGFAVVSKKIPHFGEVQRWKEEKTSRKKIALNIYNEGLQHLVATTGKCSGDFAKDARLPSSPIFPGRKADKETKAMAYKAFKALPSYKTVIKPYIKDEYYESITSYEIGYKGKTTTWVSMYVISGSPYCGQEGGILGALWKVGTGINGKSLQFVKYIDEDLEYATDVDNDGFPEFLSRDTLTRGVPQSFELVPTGGGKKRDYRFKGTIDYDCPC